MILNYAVILSSLMVISTAGDDSPVATVPLDTSKAITRIAFGSCHDQKMPSVAMPFTGAVRDIWDAIRETRPDVMVLLGDNIYAKTEDMEVMRAEYAKLAAYKGFQQLRRSVPILATWDDNDYGRSDVGVEYPKKAQSQAIFLEFFGVPKMSPRWGREGIYDAMVVGPPGRRVQFIMLDTRYFHGPLVKRGPDEPAPPLDRAGPYVPTRDTSATMLGEAQWKWLGEQLRVPAEIRIVASSIQVISEEHGYEKWANFPHERERLFRLIRETQAKGVVFISGDRHHAELSKLDQGTPYPMYDLTSSSLNKPRLFTVEGNKHRVGEMYFQSNFGLLTIDWDSDDPVMVMAIHGAGGQLIFDQKIRLSVLR